LSEKPDYTAEEYGKLVEGESSIKRDEESPFPKEMLEILKDEPAVLDHLVHAAVSLHPDYQAIKYSDYCPTGIFRGEDDVVYIQEVCICKDGKRRALILEYPMVENQGRRYRDIMPTYKSREFTDEFPF